MRISDWSSDVCSTDLCAHFHDTRGMGLANALAALETGITRFDACLAGLGGCPHAPGASGNVTTEDLLFMLESMGIDTGCDIQAVLALRARVAQWQIGRASCRERVCQYV